MEPGSIQRANNIVETITTSVVQDGMEMKKKKTFTNNSMLENKDSKTISCEVLEEKFESHRTLLLEEKGLFLTMTETLLAHLTLFHLATLNFRETG